MSSSSGGCLIAGLLYPGMIAIVIGSGFLAWNWTEPENFWGAILFLIIWSILVKAGHFILSLIIAAIAHMSE